jgi:hypothetical protein
VVTFLSFCFSTLVYYFVILGCDWENYAYFTVSIIIFSNAAYSLGQLASVFSPDPGIALAVLSPLLVVQTLFTRFYLKKK